MISVKSRRIGDGRRLAAIFAFLVLATWVGGPAFAGSFQVDPVSIELVPGRRTTEVNVTNQGDQPVAIRVHLYRWTQQEGEDVYSETNELIASPPIFTLPANGRQLIRVGPRSGSVEGAFRVILEEIPGPANDDSGIRVTLRINLPLYVISDRRSRPSLTWSAWRNRNGEVNVEARNDGTLHSQIISIIAAGPNGQDTDLSSQMGVVLPSGGTKRWNVGTMPGLTVGSGLNLIIRNGNGEVSRSQISLVQR